jgi:hypothetical protein
MPVAGECSSDCRLAGPVAEDDSGLSLVWDPGGLGQDGFWRSADPAYVHAGQDELRKVLDGLYAKMERGDA